MKINRDKLSKLFARMGLIIMVFVLMIPLCSAASPEYDYLLGSRIMSPDFEPVVLDSVPDDISTYYSNNYVTVEPILYFDAEVVGICPIIQVDDVLYVVACAYMFGTYLYDIQDIESDDPLLNSQLIITGFANDNVAQWVADNSYVPSVTTDITSVWTSIMNWITSSLNTVQGLFFTYGVDPDPTELKAGTYRFNDVISDDIITYNIIFNSDGTPFSMIYTEIPVSAESLFHVYYWSEDESDMTAYDSSHGWYGDFQYFTLDSDTLVDESYGSWFISNTDYNDVNGYGQSSLTLLGTLAVIGVSISICFLLIGIIQRFLRLRG